MKTKFLLLATLFLGLYSIYAQTGTLYVMNGGFNVNKFNIATELDSLIYYNPDGGGVTDTLFVVKGGATVKKFNVNTQLDSIIFYKSDNVISNWPTYSEAAQSELSPTVLTVLVDFSNTNVDAVIPDSENAWAQLIYGKNQAQGNHYWYQSSGGRVQLNQAAETNGVANNGVAKVKLSTPLPTSSVAPETQDWFRNALDALTGTVDFASFDQNNDNILTDQELSVLFILNMNFSLINGAEAVANITLNHTISGTGITLENFTRSTVRQSSIGVPMHELGHHFLELNHFASPSDHGLMGMGAYGQDPVIGTLTNPSFRSGTRPTGLMGQTAIFGGLISSTPITETTRGIQLYSPEMGLMRNILELPTKDGVLYIENRTNWGYDQSIPFCEGSQGGIFFTEASQYVAPLNIPAIQRNLTATDFVEGDTPFCEYYAHAGHNDTFEYGGWRFENISVAGSTMTLDIVKLNVQPVIDHYKLVYWELDPTRPGYRRKTHKRIDAQTTPDMNLAEMVNGDVVSTSHPIWIDMYYTTGESRNINNLSGLIPSSPYVSISYGSSFTNDGAVLSTSILNVKFNTSQSYAPNATIEVRHMTDVIGNFSLSNIPTP